jgi:hypothetical protein
MILYTDNDDRYLGHLDQAYPADPAVLEKVRQEQAGGVYDIPPLTPECWYFPDGVPTIRPALDYTISEKKDGADTVTVITGIPAGVVVDVTGPQGMQSVEADGDDLELVLRSVGEYAITFDPFPCRPVAIRLEVAKGV